MKKRHLIHLPAALVVLIAAAPVAGAQPTMVNIYGKAENGALLSARFMPTESPASAAAHPAATGTLTGMFIDPTGAAHPLEQQVVLPVHQFAGSTSNCQAPDVMLGPADLELLGVVMHVEQSQLPLSSGRCPTVP